MVLFCLVMSSVQASSPVGGWATATFFCTTWEGIEGFHLQSMGSCQLGEVPSVHFSLAILLFFIRWAILQSFSQGDEKLPLYKASLTKLPRWWYTSPKYGKLPVRRSSICPFQRLIETWMLLLPFHQKLRLLDSCPSALIKFEYSKINDDARIRTLNLKHD